VAIEQRLEAAGRIGDPGEARVGPRDRVDARPRPEPVGVEVVVGEAEQEEVERILVHELLGDAGRVLVAGAGTGERRPAPGRAARVDVAVEELVRAPDRVAEVRRRGRPTRQALEPELVAAAAPVDQERRRGSPDPGVAESLEHRLGLPAEVIEVHVVDEVVHRPEQAECPGRLERGAVLDVAALEAMEPVHPDHPVAGRTDPGEHLRRADGRHRGEARDHVGDELAALGELGERRRRPGLDRAAKHLGMHRVDDDEDELLRRHAYLSTRRPSCFCWARRRRETQSQISAARASSETGGTTRLRIASTSAARTP
jgi:hypothetical protein